MQRILFFSFYGLREFILDIGNGFLRHNFHVYDFPYLKFRDENVPDNDIIHRFVQTVRSPSGESDMIDFVFFFTLPGFIDSLKSNVDKRVKFIFYHFDDPLSVNIDLVRYSRYIDYFITPQSFSTLKLKTILDISPEKISHVPIYITTPRDVHDPTDEDHYDICIIYDDSIRYAYDYKKIVKSIKMLAIEKQFNIKLFGPDFLEKIYPDIYLDTLDDMECIGRPRIAIYLKYDALHQDHRVIGHLFKNKILVMTFRSKIDGHILKDRYNCIIFQKNNYLEKIYNAVKNYKKYSVIPERALQFASNNLSIDRWINDIIRIIS